MAGKPQRGRPRSFDTNEALRGAMELFWKRGYDAATLPELLDAMGGISPPSFYAAFGSKEKVFADAVALYRQEVAGPVIASFESGATAKEAFTNLVNKSLDVFAGHGTPTGCLMVLGGVNTANEAIARMMHEVRCDGADMLRRRIRKGIVDGDVPAAADVNAMVAFYTATMYGLALGARDGMTRASLRRVADTALGAWDVLAGGRRTAPRRRRTA